MRFGVLLPLTAALLLGRPQLCSAEADPLPAALIDLVRNSFIFNVDDLKLLLQQESNTTEDDLQEREPPSNQPHGRYSRSLAVEAELAQQAVCKVRTQVMEVTRSMLDRRNANFLLWPPCIEVQRCSGCCNTATLQCIPTVTATRYLQVIKIQYINRKARFDKSIISVEDHVSCRCQPSSLSSSSSSSLSVPLTHSISHGEPRPAPPNFPRAAPPSTSKADLHRHDDLKHNQQRRGYEGTYTHLVHWTQRTAPISAHQTFSSLPEPARSWTSEVRAEPSVTEMMPPVGHGSGYGGSKEEVGVHSHANGGSRMSQHRLNQELRTEHGAEAPQSDSGGWSPSERPPPLHSPTAADKDVTEKSQEVTPHRQTQSDAVQRKTGNQREDGGSANSEDSTRTETTNQRKEPRGSWPEGERREHLLEREGDTPTPLQTHPPPQRPEPTVFKTEFSSVAPAPPSAPLAPFRPTFVRRRRKHRKRISKAALRTMIM